MSSAADGVDTKPMALSADEGAKRTRTRHGHRFFGQLMTPEQTWPAKLANLHDMIEPARRS